MTLACGQRCRRRGSPRFLVEQRSCLARRLWRLVPMRACNKRKRSNATLEISEDSSVTPRSYLHDVSAVIAFRKGLSPQTNIKLPMIGAELAHRRVRHRDETGRNATRRDEGWGTGGHQRMRAPLGASGTKFAAIGRGQKRTLTIELSGASPVHAT